MRACAGAFGGGGVVVGRGGRCACTKTERMIQRLQKPRSQVSAMTKVISMQLK